MPWLPPAYIASLISSAVLVWVFGFLYAQYRERHLELWTWGWLFYTLRFILLLLDEVWLRWVDMEHLVHVCVLLSGYFLFLGTAAFVNKPVARGWHLGLAAGLLWIPVSHLADLEFFLTNLPVFTFCGLTSIWTGLLILRTPDLVKGGGQWMTGGSFILWGVHKLGDPLLRSLPWFASWGFLLSALLSFTVAIGMLLLYFQQMRKTLRERKLSLQLSEEQYQQLFRQFKGLLDGIPDLLLLFDPDLRVVWGNRSAHLMGGELRVLEGAGCGDLQKNWEIPCDVAMLVDAFSWGRTEEARLATPDGRSWGVKVFPVRDLQGKTSQVILWASDITEKSRLRDEAQRATRLASLGELAAGMAHEINNPNGLILLNLPILFDCFSDALAEFEGAQMQPTLGGLAFDRVCTELPELLQETQQAARRIKRIVDDLKDFVRQESSESGEIFDLNEVVRAATRMLANPIRTATDHFTLACAESLPPVRGNFQRLEQVVVNLTVNACQALPDRSRKLQLRTSFDPPTGEVLLRVLDEGVGIDPDNLPHLTDPFFTTRRDQGGTGLGLSVSARIVHEHEGQLEFNSTPGRGTIVTLRLPAVIKETSP